MNRELTREGHQPRRTGSAVSHRRLLRMEGARGLPASVVRSARTLDATLPAPAGRLPTLHSRTTRAPPDREAATPRTSICHRSFRWRGSKRGIRLPQPGRIRRLGFGMEHRFVTHELDRERPRLHLRPTPQLVPHRRQEIPEEAVPRAVAVLDRTQHREEPLRRHIIRIHTPTQVPGQLHCTTGVARVEGAEGVEMTAAGECYELLVGEFIRIERCGLGHGFNSLRVGRPPSPLVR